MQTPIARVGFRSCELSDGPIRFVFGDELSIRLPELNRPSYTESPRSMPKALRTNNRACQIHRCSDRPSLTAVR